jgi:hypothetical protein
MECKIPNRSISLISGRFHLTALLMRFLSEHGSERSLPQAIQKLPDHFGGAFDDTFERIMDQGEDLTTVATTALRWIVYAKEPLTIASLSHAVRIDLTRNHRYLR